MSWMSYIQKTKMALSLNLKRINLYIIFRKKQNNIEKKIKPEDKESRILCYFKFPAKFKIFIPKILGNYYNPDWGIICLDKNGNTKVQLVRETKGSEDLIKLRFSNERRKK
jgi:restriction endonuclease